MNSTYRSQSNNQDIIHKKLYIGQHATSRHDILVKRKNWYPRLCGKNFENHAKTT